jgi:hypothetical protein
MPGLDVFLDECTAFPHGANNDQVDALSQFLGWQSTGSKPSETRSTLVRTRPRDKYALARKMTGR